MNLLYVTSLTLPSEWAHSIQISKMCESFADQGADVTLFYPKRSLALKEGIWKYHQIKQNFKVIPISPIDLAKKDPGKIWYYIRTLSFIAQVLPRILFKRNSAVYVREPILGAFIPKVFLEVHTIPQNPSFLFKWSCRRALGVITITGPLQKMVIDLGVKPEKTMVAPSAVDLSKFSLRVDKEMVRNELGLSVNNKIIGYVGQFGSVGLPKGIDTLIQIIKKLPDNYNLLLVGGDEKSVIHFKEFANSLGVQHKVIFTGQVPHEVTNRYMQAADVLMVAYPEYDFYKYFTSPMKIFEYMAAGKPIVATDFPTLQEALGDSALLVGSQDIDGYVKAIEKITADPQYAQRLGEAAYAKVKENTWANRARVILNFVQAKI
jgi:glycosyltransferase involved in cell wall biosynthesis